MGEEDEASRWARRIEERLAAMVAAGQLEVVGVDEAGRSLYQAVRDA